ncbi:MAG: sensor histidine kinase [Bacteroidota bacterium]|jgi:signal transduction histidine kinase
MNRYSFWKLVIFIGGIGIVIASYFYSNFLAEEISRREEKTMQEWVAAQKMIANAYPGDDLTLSAEIIAEQKNIPVIETDEKDSIMSYLNIDADRVLNNDAYLKDRLQQFKGKERYITTYLSEDRKKFNRYYYGESLLLMQVRYFPMVQLMIVVVFSIIILTWLSNRHRSIQNQLWASLAKETAHQLGTPISALAGWNLLLQEGKAPATVLSEMTKDIDRLKLIADRFGMIGGVPKKSETDLVELVFHAADYMKKRASEKISIQIINYPAHPVKILLSHALIEWVIENILKNALDAMDGVGLITIEIIETAEEVLVDISDSGKGISASIQNEIFNPGFTTKKRGWGLGLTLARRIVQEYHNGRLTVKNSEIGKGTTFRIAFVK